MQKINKLEALLDRFDYETEFKLGFAFYLGGASLVGLPGQPVEGILTARRQLADFDIIEEYEELLDPLTARFEKLRRLEKKKKRGIVSSKSKVRLSHSPTRLPGEVVPASVHC